MIYIYKALQRGLVPVAHLTLAAGRVTVSASEQLIGKVLDGALSRPAKLSEWRGNELVKTEPKTPEEHLVARLKRFLPRPYFASRDVPDDAVQARYVSSVEVAREP